LFKAVLSNGSPSIVMVKVASLLMLLKLAFGAASLPVIVAAVAAEPALYVKVNVAPSTIFDPCVAERDRINIPCCRLGGFIT
jgi:hypothetical protein